MAEITAMIELIVLSASRPAIAETQAEQKDQHKRAHPECGIGGHSFLCRRPGSATARLHERFASRVRRTRLQQWGVGINLPSPDKFVGLAIVPCGGMPHILRSC